jgi:hypothetical protein
MVQPVINDTEWETACESITMAEPKTQSKSKGMPNMVAISEQEFGELKECVENLEKRFDKFEQRLFGNGNPGIIIDLEKLSNALTQLSTVAQEQHKSIELLKKETPKNWLIRNWKSILFWGVLIFIILHAIVPANMTVWDWLSKIF